MKHDKCPGEKTPGGRGKGRGFTLVELLVAIGIVAVLAGILIPVIGAARERGRRAACQSNLRQISMAFQQYLQDNGGVYPLDQTTQSIGGVRYGEWWTQTIYPYVKNDKIFLCPDEPSDAPWAFANSSVADHPPFTDYGYDIARLNVFVPPYPTHNIHGVNEAQLTTPATINLNADLVWISPDQEYHYGRLVENTSCGRSLTGSTLHSGGGNYSFIDGHVKWLTPEEIAEVECANSPLPAPFK